MPKGPKGEKRPADVSQRAKLIVDIATGEVEEEPVDQVKKQTRPAKKVEPSQAHRV